MDDYFIKITDNEVLYFFKNKKIIDFGEIGKSKLDIIENILNTKVDFSIQIGNKSKEYLMVESYTSVSLFDDEWFIVECSDDNYKCDQFDGLIEFLKFYLKNL